MQIRISYTNEQEWKNYKEEIWVVLERGKGQELWHFANGEKCWNNTKALWDKKKIKTTYRGVFDNEEEARKHFPKASLHCKQIEAPKFKRGGKTLRKKTNGNYDVEVDGEIVMLFKSKGIDWQEEMSELVNQLLNAHYEETYKIEEDYQRAKEELEQKQKEFEELESKLNQRLWVKNKK